MSTELLSYDIFISHYKKQVSLFRDLHKIDQLAKKEKWSAVLDFEVILLRQGKAIQITNEYGKVLFTSGNLDRFAMVVSKSYELYANKPDVTRFIFIYSMQYRTSFTHTIHSQ